MLQAVKFGGYLGKGLSGLVAGFMALNALAQDLPASDPSIVKGLVVSKDGNVGIGAAKPRAKLQVTGDAIVEGNLIVNGVVKGPTNSAAIVGVDGAGKPVGFMFRAGPPIQIVAFSLDGGNRTSTFKTFIIDHPQDLERYLVHASIEGPEGAVYYRGSAALRAGQATVVLPGYFESLTRTEGRTIQLTNMDGFDLLAVRSQNGAKIANGRFIVISKNRASNQRFDWEVKAVRADGPPLVVEPLKADVSVGGFGPYTYGQAAGKEGAQPRGRE